MELTDQELKDFRERALQASQYGHEIGLAELYTEALTAEVGQEEVPHGTVKASAAHLFDLADQALRQRAGDGIRTPKRFPANPEFQAKMTELLEQHPELKGKTVVVKVEDLPPLPTEDPKPEETGEAPQVDVSAEETEEETEAVTDETAEDAQPEGTETSETGPVSKKGKKSKK